jgi:nucleotide-binding universal stress UspA family protein
MTTRKIIVGYDLSADAKNAARWALDEADRTGAAVELLFAFEWPLWAPAASLAPAGPVWPDSETEQAIKNALFDAITEAKRTHPAVPVTVETVDGNAALALVDRSAGAGLVVLGSRGHSAVANLLGSAGVTVTAQAQSPVVVVRGLAEAGTPVVVGYDGSTTSEAAVAFAAEQAAARGAVLRVIQAFKPATSPTVPDADRKHLEEVVAGWRVKFPDLTIYAEAVVEHPVTALTAASGSAQLLVVGSRGRGALRGMLLGSVSQHLLRHSACSIAVVHDTMA